MKRLLSLFLVVLLVLTCCPAANAVPDPAIEPLQTDARPALPEGFHYSDFSYVDVNGVHCYYIEAAPSASGYIYGYWIDETGARLEEAKPRRARARTRTASFASSYDAREFGLITPVEYQTGGTCWAHAATAVMEANAIKKGYATADSIDLDEYYLVWFGRKGYDSAVTDSRYDGVAFSGDLLNDGGNALYISNATQSFSGPVLESRFDVRTLAPEVKNLEPEDESTLLRAMAATYTTDTRFQFDYVNTRITELDATTAAIKQGVLDYGAVQISYYTPDGDAANHYYTKQRELEDGEVCAFYYPESHDPTHAVTVVGWDDSFSSGNFQSDCQPPDDGAWLVKNSWGSDWGDDGYFWISYCDPTITAAVAYEVEPAREFETVCSYNGVPAIYSSARQPDRFKSVDGAGAVFTVDAAGGAQQYLRKVAFGYAGTEPSYPYSFKIFADLTQTDVTNPTKGTMIYQQQGTAYQNTPFIDVTGDVVLEGGKRYSIVFDMKDVYGTTFPIYYEGRSVTSSVYYQSKQHETFYYSSGLWNDAVGVNYNSLYIQMFTSRAHEDAPQVTFVCPGGFRTTVPAVNQTVALPQTDGCIWRFTYNGEAFDGTGVTHDMTVLSHCCPADGTEKPGESCVREFKCKYCGERMMDDLASHVFEETTVEATLESPGYHRVYCTLCGKEERTPLYYAGALSGELGGVFWQYVDGILSFAGEGSLPDYRATQRKPWNSVLGSITRVVVNDGITKIGNRALAYLSSLESVSLPESLTTLGDSVFESCTSLTAATLPGSLNSYGANLFSGCKSLETLTIGEGVTALNKAMLTIPNTTYHLKTLNLPSTLTALAPAFYENGLLTLETITVADGNPQLCAVDGVLFDASLTKLILYPPARAAFCYTVPEEVTTLESHAFAHCSGIGYLDLSQCAVTSLSQNVLADVRNLKGLNLPLSLETVESQAIYLGEGTLLPGLFISSAVTQIDDAAISGTVPVLYTDDADAAIKSYADANGYDCTVIGTHAHAFTVPADAQASTCITQGYRVNSCACGAFEAETLPLSTDHRKTNPVVTAPTCTEEGYTTYTCDLCGTVFQSDTTQKTAHTYQWVIDTNATCGKAGAKHEACTTCGSVRNENTVIPATGAHTYQWVIDTDATCGEAGTKHEACTTCGSVRSENTVIPATGAHTYQWVIDTNATCGKAGTKHEACTTCGSVRSEDTAIPATGAHTYQWVIDTNATCGKDGVKHEACTVCGSVRSANTVIPATGAHTFTRQTTVAAAQKSAADCEHAATYYYTCADCGAIERNDSHVFQSGAALGHTSPDRDGKCTRCSKQIAEPERDPNACPYCGEVHGGLFGWLIKLIHTILFRIRGAK